MPLTGSGAASYGQSQSMQLPLVIVRARRVALSRCRRTPSPTRRSEDASRRHGRHGRIRRAAQQFRSVAARLRRFRDVVPPAGPVGCGGAGRVVAGILSRHCSEGVLRNQWLPRNDELGALGLAARLRGQARPADLSRVRRGRAAMCARGCVADCRADSSVFRRRSRALCRRQSRLPEFSGADTARRVRRSAGQRSERCPVDAEDRGHVLPSACRHSHGR